ncbi:tRNA (adenosine(37)-N6)-dimethylallyltransferase MiaA [Phenylobacterium sp.]|jgi:tRNA dimethylallyltransferase|uniref:tRNA (adenosine(37)-N6)-dimethylallyltransferase MiaA n=1 Tax=Phenylobacterium sp. TaxID=1871053 RepID=UPI002F3E3DA1
MPPRIWLIAGPTASGKSALALRLAERDGGEIVNADALQLYADLRVLSARPDPAEEARAPHHLFGVADAADGWSTGRWLRAATDVLADIAARGRDAIVVGGAGLYFHVLTHGLAEIPAVPADVRRQAAADFEALGEAAFRDRLAAADPAAARRIAPGDRQRLSRAWEVFAATRTALSDWQARTTPTLAPGAWRAIALEPPRAALYARCDARFEAMVAAGALEEAAALLARGLDPALPAMKAVGLRELGDFLRGEADLPAATAAARQQTRRYAKRQLTWLRNQIPGWPRLDAADPEGQWRQFLAQAAG